MKDLEVGTPVVSLNPRTSLHEAVNQLLAGLGYQTLSTANEPQEFFRQTKTWPRHKKEMVDSLLLAYGVPFGVAETVSVKLSDGRSRNSRRRCRRNRASRPSNWISPPSHRAKSSAGS